MSEPAYAPSDLTVVIPTRGRWDILRRTLDALSGQTVSGFGTLVVLDGEDQAAPADVTVRTLTVPWGGPGAARNAGVAEVATDLVLFLGDDMIPTPALVERHLERHNAFPEPESAVLGHVDWHPEVRRTRLMRWYDWSGGQFDYANIEGDDAQWGRFYSCNVSLKRTFFLDTGGFDPDFVFDYEDLDLARRLHEKGLSLHYARDAVVHHLHEYDWAGMERRYRSRARAEWLMTRKHDWFEPWFAGHIHGAVDSPHVSRVWELFADALPAGSARTAARDRVNRRYLQRLAPTFFDAWKGEEDLEELREYLGPDYDHAKLQNHVREVEREEEAAADETSFCRLSTAHLYDLTVFAMSGTNLPYRRALQRIMPTGSRLLDYGCGIGSDGLRFLDAGYDVEFADFTNPSVRYLRWRLARRNRTATIHDVEKHVPSGYDAVYCFDVIEHVEDPFAFLAELESRGRVVAVNFLEPDPNDTHVHHDLPIKELMAHVEQRGLLHYRRYHGRSHLVIYGEPPARSGLRSRAVRTFEMARSRMSARGVRRP
jgi:GT2 family glycosyltransferase/2-polyprenyl-3-methyl-5-hydroxy-6-metoxy-1,4-benzoquinol methylase